MLWLSRLFRHRDEGCGAVVGDGAFAFPVVGESRHQPVLEELAGGRTRDGARHFCAALIVPQPNNPYDPHAVAVYLRDQEVGYLARDVAPDFLRTLRLCGYGRAACEAVIVGGWDRGPTNRGYFGVRLNACLPFRLQSADEWKRQRQRQRN